jgi:hypothetical protein
MQTEHFYVPKDMVIFLIVALWNAENLNRSRQFEEEIRTHFGYRLKNKRKIFAESFTADSQGTRTIRKGRMQYFFPHEGDLKRVIRQKGEWDWMPSFKPLFTILGRLREETRDEIFETLGFVKTPNPGDAANRGRSAV